MDGAYTNRELENFFTELHEKIDKNASDQKERDTRIETQVKATNGRVKSLELWRAFLAGGLAILTLLVLPLLFIVLQKFL